MKLYKLFGVTENWREEKKEYKAYLKRVDAMPDDYKFVFKEIQDYMWTFSDFTGQKILEALSDLLDMFEEGAANNVDVFTLTGDDVGEFADGIVREVASTWIEDRKAKWIRKLKSLERNKNNASNYWS